MKLFASILSIYILFLTALPCVDRPLENHNHKTECSGNTGSSQHDESDHCSPFCTCSCCASPRIQQDFIVEFKNFSFPQELLSEYISNFISYHFATIWQPPKIA